MVHRMDRPSQGDVRKDATEVAAVPDWQSTAAQAAWGREFGKASAAAQAPVPGYRGDKGSPVSSRSRTVVNGDGSTDEVEEAPDGTRIKSTHTDSKAH